MFTTTKNIVHSNRLFKVLLWMFYWRDISSAVIICSSETHQEHSGICQNPSSLSKKVQFEQFSQFPIVSVAKQPLFLLVCPLITLWWGKNEEIWPPWQRTNRPRGDKLRGGGHLEVSVGRNPLRVDIFAFWAIWRRAPHLVTLSSSHMGRWHRCTGWMEVVFNTTHCTAPLAPRCGLPLHNVHFVKYIFPRNWTSSDLS